MIAKNLSPNVSDLFGLASDLAVGVVIFLAFPRRASPFRLPWLVMTWIVVIVAYFNVDSILVNNSNLDFRFAEFAKDGGFVLSSIGSLHRPFQALLLLLFPLAGSAFLALRKSTTSVSRGGTRVAGIVGASAFASILLWSHVPDPLEGWRRSNAFVQVGDNALGHVMSRVFPHSPRGQMARQSPVDDGPPDEVGEKFFSPTHERPPNVLLILVESMNGAHLFNEEYRDATPKLRSWAKRGFTFKNIVTHTVQTHRGEFALLCGMPCNLGLDVAKSDLIAQGKRAPPACLPQLLKDRGYQTVYLQSANLTFMQKDQFLPKIGFDHNMGIHDFKTAKSMTGWGPDDVTLYEEKTFDVLSDLAKRDAPWFLMTLNAGTHWPYNVPADWQSPFAKDSMAHAVSYADHAVDGLLQKMERGGFLENTYVIITGDEAKDLGKGSSAARILQEHWTSVIVLGPKVYEKSIPTFFAQPDVARSIFELVVPEVPAPFRTRSLFRNYRTGRDLFFTNVFTKTAGVIEKDGSIGICANLDQCATAGKLTTEIEIETETEALVADDGRLAAKIRQNLQRNDWAADASDSRTLIRPGSIRMSGLGMHKAYAWQNFRVGAGEVISSELNFRYLNGPPITVIESIWSMGKPLYGARRRALRSGESYRSFRDYKAGVALQNVELSLAIELSSATEVSTLDFVHAVGAVNAGTEAGAPGILRDDVTIEPLAR